MNHHVAALPERLRTARKRRAWSQLRLVRELRMMAGDEGLSLPSDESVVRRISSWENGEHQPDEVYRRLLALIFEELTELSADQGGQDGCIPETMSPVVHPVASPLAYTDGIDVVGAFVTAAADAERFALWAESSAPGSIALDGYREELSSLATDFLHQPMPTLLPGLVRLRNRLFHQLQARQDRSLWALAGMTSVVLAHASHVVGNALAGRKQARVARMCANEANHVELLAWTCGTQGLIAECAGRLREAAQHMREAADVLSRSRMPGSAAVRLASYEARINARLGLEQEAKAAVERAEIAQARLPGQEASELDDIGGILSFPPSKQLFYAAESFLLLRDPEQAELHAMAAIESFDAGPPEHHSYGDVALARIDMGAARLADDNLDGVLVALEPVFALPPQLRIAPLVVPLNAIDQVLAGPRYQRANAATGIRQEMVAFRAETVQAASR